MSSVGLRSRQDIAGTLRGAHVVIARSPARGGTTRRSLSGRAIGWHEIAALPDVARNDFAVCRLPANFFLAFAYVHSILLVGRRSARRPPTVHSPPQRHRRRTKSGQCRAGLGRRTIDGGRNGCRAGLSKRWTADAFCGGLVLTGKAVDLKSTGRKALRVRILHPPP